MAGYMHPVQWFQDRDKVDEEEAIKRWEHTRELFDQYPVDAPSSPTPAPQTPGQPGNPGGDRAPIDTPTPPKAA